MASKSTVPVWVPVLKEKISYIFFVAAAKIEKALINKFKFSLARKLTPIPTKQQTLSGSLLY
jgi:hypothetical protein